jgi:hypothetical protein
MCDREIIILNHSVVPSGENNKVSHSVVSSGENNKVSHYVVPRSMNRLHRYLLQHNMLCMCRSDVNFRWVPVTYTYTYTFITGLFSK